MADVGLRGITREVLCGALNCVARRVSGICRKTSRCEVAKVHFVQQAWDFMAIRIRVWSVKSGVRSVMWEVWSGECRVESVKCEVWSVECEVWSGEWRVRSGECEV